MNARKAKVWNTEDQILVSIDRAQKKLLSCQQIVEHAKDEIARLAKEIMSLKDGGEIGERKLAIAEYKESITKAEKQWRRIEDTTLPKLKSVLAAFRTKTMLPVLGEYKGVALK
jgi:ABC-type molybdate transport system ATPase subunit